ncbi:zinc finger protein 2-like [Micropterus salmoides]|uniref:zinc finger protein 2-like n=1 Tax=Micropterus salmoides TaxID=27706 RepID=UPI0018EA9F95|nr:zinc finger protein 2-like [Micropterus salmoides]
MSKVQTLRAFVQQRLSAAAEEIFELFERTIAEYEEELCGQRKLLDAVFKPEVRLHRADVQLLLVTKEEVPPEQQECRPRLDQEDPSEPQHIKEEWSSSLDQEDPSEPQHIKEEWSSSLDQEDPPEPPHIKKEQEERLISQEGGEQLQRLGEANFIKFTFTPVPVKSKLDEEKPQSSQLHQRLTEQMETEADGENCGGPEPARNSDADGHLQPATHDKMSHSSETETDESDWEETREPESGSNPLQNSEVPVSDQEFCTGKTSSSSSEFATSFGHEGCLQEHSGLEKTGEEPLSSVCGKGSVLTKHLTGHTGEKPFSCSVCKRNFKNRSSLSKHMRTHTGEKPFSCSVCGNRFTQKSDVRRHSTVHTDARLPSLSKEDVPSEQQERSPSLDQEDPPDPPHIKEEQEELWTSQEGEKLEGLEEEEITMFTFTPVPVKSEEDDEEKPQSSQLHQRLTEQMETKANEEDCGGPEPARNSDPDGHLQPATDDETSDSEPETDGSCDWEEAREPQSGSNSMQNNEECATSFGPKECLQEHNGAQTGEKPRSCSVCDKRFFGKDSFRTHMRLHSKEKCFHCSVCKTSFVSRSHLSIHERIHTGEKPFSCSVCGKRYFWMDSLKTHMSLHSEAKRFSCSVCKRTFSFQSSLSRHMNIHKGEEPFSCSVCGKTFY